jgi:hypothetical protein
MDAQFAFASIHLKYKSCSGRVGFFYYFIVIGYFSAFISLSSIQVKNVFSNKFMFAGFSLMIPT